MSIVATRSLPLVAVRSARPTSLRVRPLGTPAPPSPKPGRRCTAGTSVGRHDSGRLDHRPSRGGDRPRHRGAVRRLVGDGSGRPGAHPVETDPRRGPRRRRRPAGERARARRSRGDPRADEPRVDDDRPRLLVGRHRVDGAAAADADGLARGVHRGHAGAHPSRRRQARVDRRSAGGVLRGGRQAIRRSSRWARCSRARRTFHRATRCSSHPTTPSAS